MINSVMVTQIALGVLLWRHPLQHGLYMTLESSPIKCRTALSKQCKKDFRMNARHHLDPNS